MWHPTKLNWQEPTAYAASVVALAVGLCLGWVCDPAWLARAGSVVIVNGVLLASSRKIDLLYEKVKALVNAHRASEFQAVLSEFINRNGTAITSAQAEALERRIYGEAHEEISMLVEERRRIFKLHEVVLVVAGTLVNGFGEWALKLAMHSLKCAT
jgi:hypothetical protein